MGFLEKATQEQMAFAGRMAVATDAEAARMVIERDAALLAEALKPFEELTRDLKELAGHWKKKTVCNTYEGIAFDECARAVLALAERAKR